MSSYNPFRQSIASMPRQATQPAAEAPQAAPGTVDPALVHLLAQAAFQPSTTADYCASNPARAALEQSLPADLYARLQRGEPRTPSMDRDIRIALLCGKPE